MTGSEDSTATVYSPICRGSKEEIERVYLPADINPTGLVMTLPLLTLDVRHVSRGHPVGICPSVCQYIGLFPIQRQSSSAPEQLGIPRQVFRALNAYSQRAFTLDSCSGRSDDESILWIIDPSRQTCVPAGITRCQGARERCVEWE